MSEPTMLRPQHWNVRVTNMRADKWRAPWESTRVTVATKYGKYEAFALVHPAAPGLAVAWVATTNADETAWAREGRWSLTHVNSGMKALSVFDRVECAMGALRDMAALTDWTCETVDKGLRDRVAAAMEPWCDMDLAPEPDES